MTRISIVVPVFNAEKYLGECLDSILKALTGVEGEILAVDNDSSDDSLAILKKYADKHPETIKVLQCHTWGAAAVKNYGVSKARGEYIWFIDADDYIAEDAIFKLLKKADDTEADMVMMGAKRVYSDGGVGDGHKNVLTPVSPDEPDYKSRFVRYGMGPWQVLIRRKWWNEHGFRFREGMIHEDMELMSSLILYTDKFACVDEPLYFYRQTQESVLHRRVWSERAYDIFPALEGLYMRFKEAEAVKTYHDELEWFFIWNLLIDSAKDFEAFPEGKPGFARSRRMLNKYFPGWRKNRFLKAKPIKFRIKVRLNYSK